MQDRFKFRVWDKDRKKMFNCIQINITENAHGSNCVKDNETSIHLMYQPHLILIQCTGLKDKNRKLIYEGDILKDKYGALHPISWNDKGFYEADTFAVAGFYNAIQEDMEVIGNIYENPELIKK